MIKVNAEKAQRLANQRRVEELKALLRETDHKALGDYEPKAGENLGAIYSQRRAWRNEIRSIEAR